MKSKEYNVTLKTPIGKRLGKFRVNKKDNKIWGTLSILNHSRPFSGEIDKEGECTITGSFLTLLRPVFYTAIGHITDTDVDLSLKDERNSYRLSGFVLERPVV